MSHRSVPAPFLTKTYHLVDDSATADVISWNDDGTTFVVWKTANFAKDLLLNSFKHNNCMVACKECGNYGWGGCGAHLVTLYASIDKGKHCMCRSWPGVVIPKSDKPSGSTTPAITTTTTTAGTAITTTTTAGTE